MGSLWEMGKEKVESGILKMVGAGRNRIFFFKYCIIFPARELAHRQNISQWENHKEEPGN